MLGVAPSLGGPCIRIQRDAALEILRSGYDSQEISLLHFEIVHELDVMPDFVHESQHRRGFSTIFDEVGVQRDDALPVGAESPERIALAGDLYHGVAAR